MPKKYHIDVQHTPNRYPIIGRSGIVDWGEGCLKCAQCVKQQCVYDVYNQRSFSTDILVRHHRRIVQELLSLRSGVPQDD